jgi:hypothetical protein
MGRRQVHLLVSLVLLAGCHHGHPPMSGSLHRPLSTSEAPKTLYQQHKMDRIAHYMSKYWDGGHGDPLDVFNLTLTHESATGCHFSVFHSYRRGGDLAFAHTRQWARAHLRAMGADAVGFGQYHGDWWAVAEDCA